MMATSCVYLTGDEKEEEDEYGKSCESVSEYE